MNRKFDNSIQNIYNIYMKILLLVIPSMMYSAGDSHNQTFHIAKDASQKLKCSISTFRSIYNKSNKNVSFFV